mmetsp:Transcript_82096/g.265958  ORF Transcript_82096/g.265958 Transcript_82096/m.265958 type:complete len:91 (+) Transcript_82096:1371-1643(+)
MPPPPTLLLEELAGTAVEAKARAATQGFGRAAPSARQSPPLWKGSLLHRQGARHSACIADGGRTPDIVRGGWLRRAVANAALRPQQLEPL